mgnify:CR=1 FL=1
MADYNFSNFKAKLKGIEDSLSKEYSKLTVGRASPMVLDGVYIESYGARMPLKNVVSISVEDQKTLRITPFDKNQIKEIEKAITNSNLGLSVVINDTGMRVIFPQLTTETRQNLVKILKEKLEESRIAVRRERDQIWNEIQDQEKKSGITNDEKFRAKENLQKIINETNSNLENIFSKKEKEVLS